ncbi:hypothetical protein AXL65_02220 [Salmonella enterica subsp. enterica]|nr:hypothetical protein [Salmonella enterica subsp. enterica]
MQSIVPRSEKSARMRLSRALQKKNQKVIVNKANTPARAIHGRYTIIDENNRILSSSDTLTPWLQQNDLLKSWEYVIGEEGE